jgi:hypothetical protein
MTMKKNKKKKRVTYVVAILLLLAAVTAVSEIGSRGDLPEAQTARIERRALLESKVTANGEVRPIQFINLTTEVSGRVTDIVRIDKAIFTPVKTGITGQNEIEITSGLSEQQEIIIGPYRQLRTLKDGVAIHRDNGRAQLRFQ